jgi:glycosyltransferase involved in cell wall biosynthesis
MDVTILTAMPNYPAMKIRDGYVGKWYHKETIDGIIVHRSWIFVKKTNSVAIRLLNYFSFVFTSLFVALFKLKKYDIIICESPPLFLGISALAIKFFKRSKLVFNVSDLWPESAEKLGIVSNSFFLKLAYNLEARLYKNAALVSGQTQGIISSISARFPNVKTHWLPNGIDNTKLNSSSSVNWRSENGLSEADFVVLYAGILGYAQALEVILKAASLVKDNTIKFVIACDGPQREYLENLKIELHLDNVTFLGNKPTEEMPSIIKACDTAIIPLKNITLFKGAIPSKIFENLAFGKPILLGVDGEAKELFINQGNCGLFFTPDNQQELSEAILKLKNDVTLRTTFGSNGKKYVQEKFDRKTIAHNFYNELLKV